MTLTTRPVHVIPYWANQRIWRLLEAKGTLRKKHGLPDDGFLIGSFQRDTEGRDLISPKLEKGPDLFVLAVDALRSRHQNVHVVLAGWRRQYIISRLNELHIPYTYVELPEQRIINELYQTLDLYVVSSRYEGGPQSLLECGLLRIPCISRDVGMASTVLPASAVQNDLLSATASIPDVNALKLPMGYQCYRDLLESM